MEVECLLRWSLVEDFEWALQDVTVEVCDLQG